MSSNICRAAQNKPADTCESSSISPVTNRMNIDPLLVSGLMTTEIPFCVLGSAARAFALDSFTYVTIIVDVHEEILAPFSTRLCVVAKHHALELHTQRRLRSQQRHACFRGRAIALPLVAGDTRRHDVHGRVISTTRTRQNVIECQVARHLLQTAVLTTKLVAHVNTRSLHA